MGDTIYGDKVGRDKNVHHYAPSAPADRRPAGRAPVLLLLSANPAGTSRLRLDEERRAIRHSIALSQAERRLDVQVEDAVQRDDLQSALLRHRPAVVHFGGHGTRDGLVVTDDDGFARSVPPAALTELFRILGGTVQCVLLNACSTADQAAAVAEHVPCVIGMFGPVQDEAAIRLAAGFYEGLARGENIRTAYDLGRNRLSLRELDDHPPLLFAREGVAEQTVVVP